MLKIIISLCCSCHKILAIGINFRFDELNFPEISVSHGYCSKCLDKQIKETDKNEKTS